MRLLPSIFVGALVATASVSLAGLGIGDPAPELTITHWVKGSPVDLASAKGKNVVVVEFWATWCAPCIHAIPHMTKMQNDYLDKGAIFVGVTAEDPGNTLERVTKFVEKQGDRMGYTVAFDGGGKSYDRYMLAAQQQGIPTAFVIDTDGLIAWIGHPMEDMDEVVHEVVAGTYDREVGRQLQELAKEAEQAWYDDASFKTYLKIADKRIALKPNAGSSYANKFYVLLQAEADEEDLLATASKAVELWSKRPDKLGDFAADIIGAGDGDAFRALALEAIDQALTERPHDGGLLISQFQILAASGEHKQAEAAAGRAMAALQKQRDIGGLGTLARVLSDPALGKPCGDLALQAIELAIAGDPNEVVYLTTKFHILAVCKRDDKAAKAWGDVLVEQAGDNASLLNSFAWMLLTEPETEGRFSELALEAAQRCDELTQSTSWAYVDTLAVALFETGDYPLAIEFEEKAIKLAQLQLVHPSAIDDLERALERFRKAAEESGS